MTAVVTFIGYHDSGKTAIVSEVVEHLNTLGYRVAVIKSSNESGVVFDAEGSDTFKHRQAGANSVLFVAPDQLVLQAGPNTQSLVTLAHRYFSDADIVIGEGFKHARKVPKIEVVRNKEQNLKGEVHGVIAVVSDFDITGDYVFRLHESREIAQFLEKRYLIGRGKHPEVASLLVDGRKIPLKEFVQECLAGSVAGFVEALKLTEGGQEIELRIRLDKTKR